VSSKFARAYLVFFASLVANFFVGLLAYEWNLLHLQHRAHQVGRACKSLSFLQLMEDDDDYWLDPEVDQDYSDYEADHHVLPWTMGGN
jgi:hypothetical protein